MLTVFVNIISVFAIMLLGFLSAKIKWLPKESSPYLSRLLINICSPCLILYAMSKQELTIGSVSFVLQVMLLMVLMLTISAFLSVPTVKLMKVQREDRGIYRDLLTLTNNGFMGYPLALAVFGEKGLFLMILANAAFSIFMYSAGVYLMIYDRNEKLDLISIGRSLLSLPVVASVAGLIIFAFGIKFPFPLANFLRTVGNMTIPLSMLVIGIQLSQSSIKQVLGNRNLAITVVLRLILLPVIFFLLFFKAPFDPLVFCIDVFAMAMPSAAIIVVLADVHGANAKLASEGVFLTTLFSLATIPVVAMLLTLYMKIV